MYPYNSTVANLQGDEDERITAPTQTTTATLTQTAAQSNATASATITVGINKVAKAKRMDGAVLNDPHGVPAIERRAGFPSRVSCGT
ncbi:MAG: hypothetical protein LQ349_003836 [Xanthoria aureola]|nr:MAG: hypothetical protein LQ349_003836 [Xanthoria aureola]